MESVIMTAQQIADLLLGTPSEETPWYSGTCNVCGHDWEAMEGQDLCPECGSDDCETGEEEAQ